jgi:internalin A
LYKSELLSITSLNPSGSGTIASLAGIENMSNLTSLDLSGYSISSISPLQGLVRLETLKLADNSISDISPIQKLLKLNCLDLSGNKITSISALKSLTRLKYLYLSGNVNNSAVLNDFSPVRQYYRNLIGKDFTYDGN